MVTFTINIPQMLVKQGDEQPKPGGKISPPQPCMKQAQAVFALEPYRRIAVVIP